MVVRVNVKVGESELQLQFLLTRIPYHGFLESRNHELPFCGYPRKICVVGLFVLFFLWGGGGDMTMHENETTNPLLRGVC